MPKRIERVGTTQGRLSIIRLHEDKINNRLAYVCTCSCDPSKEILKTSGSLGGGTKSCGCLYTENARKQLDKVRHMRVTHNMSKSATYVAWKNMKARCDDPNHQAYQNYKERGIGYVESWGSFEGFLEDMGECPKGLTLNRLDVNKGYCRDNCEWADNYKQGRDRRKPTRDNSSSRYKGVSFNKKEGKYKGALVHKGSYIHLGYSNSEEFLACRYDEKVIELTHSIGGTNVQLGLLEIEVFEKYLEDCGKTNLLSKEERSKLLANI